MAEAELLDASRPASQSLPNPVSRIKAYLPDVTFVAAWELQSQISSVVLVAFARYANVWETVPVMLAWSLVATVIFHQARLKGRPDMLESVRWGTRSRLWRIRLLSTLWTAFKAWIAGVQAFIFARVFGVILQTRAQCWRQRIARTTVIGFGLTMFGVPTAHHILRKAGYEKRALLQLGFVGAFLNVPYRVVLSAALINLVFGIVNPPYI